MVVKNERGKKPLYVFLSHAQADKDLALNLRAAFEQHTYVRVFTTDKLSAGEGWVSQLKAALSSCDLFIILITPNAVKSSWVLQELGAAWGLKKPILGVYNDVWDSAHLPVALNEEQLVSMKFLEHAGAIESLLRRYEEMSAA